MQLSMWAREGLLTDPRETHCSKGFFDQIGQAPVKRVATSRPTTAYIQDSYMVSSRPTTSHGIPT